MTNEVIQTDVTQIAALPAVREATSEVDQMIANVAAFQITTPETFIAGGDMLRQIKAASTKFEAQQGAMTAPIRQSLEAVRSFFRGRLTLLDNAEVALKAGLARFALEHEQKRIAEQRRLDEQSRIERERLQKIADETAAEAREKAAKAQREADAARVAGDAVKADKLEAKADRITDTATQKIEATKDRQALAVAPIVQTSAPKIAGVSMREVWDYAILDESKIPANFKKVDEAKIGQLVRSMKGDAQALLGDGVRVFKTQQVAASRKG